MNMPVAGVHILVIPYPAQGHMIPLLDLTHQLANRGLTITIVATPKNLPLLNPLLSQHHPSVMKPLVLPFPAHSSIPAGVENVKDCPSISFSAMSSALGQLYNPLLHWFQTNPSPPVAILSDMFLGWTHHLACHLNIQRIVFSPSGALALTVINSLWRHLPRRADINDEAELISFPNSLKFPWWQLSPIYRNYLQGHPDGEFTKDGFRANMASWGLVINSFTDLERTYLDHLAKEMGHDRVWAVGPLLPPDDLSGDRGGSTSVSAAEILSWLDQCADRTVVYVAFGSQAVLTNQQTDELESGLEKSGVRFVWSIVGPNPEIATRLEDRAVGRGLVIKGWAPQLLILSHRAVGGFLTHCGWNSILEALVAGVPMLTWPMGADQFSDAALLVDELKVAIRVCEGAKTIPDSDELGRAVSRCVSEDENRVLKERVMELRRSALEAVKEGGSSFKDLDGLVMQLNRLTSV